MNLYRGVYEIVRRIPKGKVMSYGQIAVRLGNPGLARAVGNALHANPYPGEVPCHRVVNRRGELTGSFAFGGEGEQRRLLALDGVKFLSDGRVDMKSCCIKTEDIGILPSDEG